MKKCSFFVVVVVFLIVLDAGCGNKCVLVVNYDAYAFVVADDVFVVVDDEIVIKVEKTSVCSPKSF